MHLWKVTSTEAGDRRREYRCERCGVTYRDDQIDRAPACVEAAAARLEPWRVRRFLDAADGNLIGERFRALSTHLERLRREVGPRDINLAHALVRVAARIISKAGVSGRDYVDLCCMEWPGERIFCESEGNEMTMLRFHQREHALRCWSQLQLFAVWLVCEHHRRRLEQARSAAFFCGGDYSEVHRLLDAELT